MIPSDPAFSVAEYRARLEAIQARMARDRVGSLLLFSPGNINYVSGLDNENLSDFQCVVLHARSDPTLILFAFERGRAANSSWIEDVVTYDRADQVPNLVATVARRHRRDVRIAIERRSQIISPAAFEEIAQALTANDVVDAFGLVEPSRLIKSPAEIAYMRRSARLTDEAINAGMKAARIGAMDGEIAAAIVSSMYAGGGETVCMGPIVAVGYRAGAPHSSFSGVPVRQGDAVFMEATAQVRRYTAPRMQTVIAGVPAAELQAVYDAGGRAIDVILSTAGPGVPAVDVARAAGAALGPVLDQIMFHHTYGYPVGLGYPVTWVEQLGFLIREDNPQLIEAGMTFHLPISLRRYGEWGMNQSRTIVITDSGAEALTAVPAGLSLVTTP